MADAVLGTPMPCREDPALLRGDTQFAGDLTLPGMLHMVLVESELGHAVIKQVDVSRAAAMPGVVRVVTASDLSALMPLPCVWVPGGVESHFPPHPYGVPGSRTILAGDKVRFVGDPVAAVVAQTRREAEAAARLVSVEYEPLPVVTRADEALKEGAPQLHDAVPGNLNAYWTCGDKDRTDTLIASAEVSVSLDICNQRTINSPMEPRAALGSYDHRTGEYTLWATTQAPHNHRFLLAGLVLGIPFTKLRVIAPAVGGSFGTKGYLYPDMPLVLFLSKELGRPVKWTDTRHGLAVSTVQGRDHQQHVTLAGTRDGHMTALRCTSYANLGAYPSTIGPGVATALMGRSISGMYDFDSAFCEVYAAFTNKVPLGAQRGSGRAEAMFLLERLVDRYAREIGMDPAEVRRRNLVPASKMPYDNGLGWTYDSGDYAAVLSRALDAAGYSAIADRKAQARRRGKRLGVGIGCFVAVCGVGPSARMSREGMLGGTWDSANIRVHPTGDVTLTVGSSSTGQSHETVFAQVAANELGIDPALFEVRHSDTAGSPYGQGTYGSRSYSVAGPAVQAAARQVRKKIVETAAAMFGVPEDAITYDGGKVFPTAEPDKAKTFQDMAMALWYDWDIPREIQPALDATTYFDPPDFNYPNGAHVATVEVDERTGAVELVGYVAVNDAGTIGNPLIVTGQVEGSIVHGIGQAFMEEARYGSDGRLLTRDFGSYPLPSAADAPFFDLDHVVTPTPHNSLGAKGAGEIATVPVTAAIVNAICDALDVEHIEMPVTSEKAWRILSARDAHPSDAHAEQEVLS